MRSGGASLALLLLCTGCPDGATGAADLGDRGVAPDAEDNPRARRWTVIRPPAPGQPNLFALWGDGPDRLFAVGSSGAILRATPDADGALDRDGRPRLHFTPMESPTGKDLTAVHGTGPGDVYAVGLGGTILHYDGVAWQAETPQRAMPGDPAFSADLWGVFSYSGGAMAVGKDGTWTRRVMGRWQVPQRLQVESLQAVWGTAPNQLWAVGSLGYIFFFDGNGWRPVAPPGFTSKLAAIFGTAGNNVYAVGLGGAVLRSSGGSFQDYGSRIDARCGGGTVPRVFLRGGTVTAMGEIILIGWEGIIVRLSEGRCGDGGMGLGAWDESGATLRRLEGIWAHSAGLQTTVYISGVEGIVLRGE